MSGAHTPAQLARSPWPTGVHVWQLLDWGADPDKAVSAGAAGALSARQLAQRISENPTDKDRDAAVAILELMGNRERVRQRMREIESRIAAQAARERRALLKSVVWLVGYACAAYVVYQLFCKQFKQVGVLDQKEL